MYNKKSIDYNRIIHLFWKCILPMICFILARRIMRNGIYVYTSIQELITKKDFTYEDVKKQVVLLCLLFFRIKFLAFFLYKTDFFLPSLKKNTKLESQNLSLHHDYLVRYFWPCFYLLYFAGYLLHRISAFFNTEILSHHKT